MRKKHFLYSILLSISLIFLFLLINYLNYNLQSGTTSISAKIAPQRLFLNCWQIIKNKYYDPTLNYQDWNRWKQHYLVNIKTEEDAYIAINSMLASLNDPYSKFLPPNEFKEQNIDFEAKITGIGVNLITLSGKFIILNTLENSPAQKNGLLSGDIIVKINGENINGKNISDVANAIRGEENSYVELELLRKNDKIKKKIQRKTIEIKTVESEILEDNIGYIKIVNFMSSNLVNEFNLAINKMLDTKGLIIDLRNNPGGVLENAILLSNAFINKGAIVNILERNGSMFPVMANQKINVFEQPVIILVNKGSASAAEIFSGALKDYNRAILIGERTYGKGMIQKVFPLPNNSGMNITVAKYLTPKGFDINKDGIQPNYQISNNKQPTDKFIDYQLLKAQKLLTINN